MVQNRHLGRFCTKLFNCIEFFVEFEQNLFVLMLAQLFWFADTHMCVSFFTVVCEQQSQGPALPPWCIRDVDWQVFPYSTPS